MKTAVVIDKKKIKLLKLKIEQRSYIEHAIDQLAYEIAWVFV